MLLYMKTNTRFWSHLTQFFLEWEIFRHKLCKKVKKKSFILIFFKKMCSLWDKVEINYRSRQVTNDTPTVCNTYCFPLLQWLLNTPQCYIYTNITCLVNHCKLHLLIHVYTDVEKLHSKTWWGARRDQNKHLLYVHSFIHSFIFRRSFTRCGNSHVSKSTRKRKKNTVAYRTHM